MEPTAATAAAKTTHLRYLNALLLFLASTLSYGDRVVLSIAAGDIRRDLHRNTIRLGYLFSAFHWTYAVAQLPAVNLLDRFGSKRVYGIRIISGTFHSALLYVAANALLAVVAYLPIVGEIRRQEPPRDLIAGSNA